MPLSNMRSDSTRKEPGVLLGAGVTSSASVGVTSPAPAQPFGWLSPSHSPSSGAAARTSWDPQELSWYKQELTPTAQRWIVSHPTWQQVPRSREVFPWSQPGAATPLGRNPAASAIEEGTVHAPSSSSRTAEQLNTTRSCSQSLLAPQQDTATAPHALGGSRASPRWED